MWAKPIVLIGEKCILKPLSRYHHDELVISTQDGELWKLWYTTVPDPLTMKEDIDRRLLLQEEGSMLPFVVLNKDTNKIIGATTFLNIDEENCRVEIGSTWINKSSQKTGINTDAKLLLLKHAFEDMCCNVVELRTHFCNHKSRKGIERLGAKLDGVLRNHMVMRDGTIRDTCVYSILKTEWPTIKTHLSWLLKQQN